MGSTIARWLEASSRKLVDSVAPSPSRSRATAAEKKTKPLHGDLVQRRGVAVDKHHATPMTRYKAQPFDSPPSSKPETSHETRVSFTTPVLFGSF